MEPKPVEVALVCLLFILPNIESTIVLESQNLTNWGEWGPWDSCPKDSFASSFRLKTEQHQESVKLDDTGLNAIELFCTRPGSGEPLGGITSSEGDNGEWGIKFRCNTGQFIEGFQLQVLAPQGGAKSGSSLLGLRDDYAATNLRIFCGGESEPLEGDGLDKGVWGRKMKCLSNQHVCAIRTQVDFAEERPKSMWSSMMDEKWIGYGGNLTESHLTSHTHALQLKPTSSFEQITLA